MKTIKFGGLQKLIAILIVAIVIVMVVGVAVSGLNEESDPSDNSSNDANNGSNENVQADNPQDNLTPEIFIPEYINYITGLEISKEGYSVKPYAFVLSSTAPLYGVGGSDLVIEVPCENGETRLLAFTNDIDDLGKIGALMPTRNYLTSVASSFGGIVCSFGKDDIVNYSALGDDFYLDLSKSKDYYYTENARYLFSSGRQIEKLSTDEGLITELLKKPNTPYKFVDFGSEIKGHGKANTIELLYSENSKTKLVYNEETKNYSFYKGNTLKSDMLTGETVEFTNVFILFADTTTYDKSTGVETVTDTLSQGSGYYATRGGFVEIRWRTNERGEMIFENLDGETLTVNRGSSYIGYFKSSGYDSVKLY